MRERKDTGNQLFSCSDSGAIQISRDFNALREWIGASESVRPETRRYLLLLDSIRQCEGVAKLLRSRPGELVDVRPIKNKVSPITGNCCIAKTQVKSENEMHCRLLSRRRHRPETGLPRQPDPGGDPGRAVRAGPAAVDKPQGQLEDALTTLLLQIRGGEQWRERNNKISGLFPRRTVGNMVVGEREVLKRTVSGQ